MIQLSRSMLEKYEIPQNCPRTRRCLLLGAGSLMLGVVARLLDEANRRGEDLGAVCVTPAIESLRAQDGLFTLLIRGEETLKEERVVQCILSCLHPEEEFDELMVSMAVPEVDTVFMDANAGNVERALLTRMLYARWQSGGVPIQLVVLGECFQPEDISDLRRDLRMLGEKWSAAFVLWLDALPLSRVLVEHLCGPLSERERALHCQEMNYRDDLIAWAEPYLRCTAERPLVGAAAELFPQGDFLTACEAKERIFDTAVFLCAVPGFLCGLDSFDQVLGDEQLREWMGRTFMDEILPSLPWDRDIAAPWIISAFERLENHANAMPLLEQGRNLLGNFSRTLLPAIRAYARREFDAPTGLSLALAAAILLYSGVRPDSDGRYQLIRGQQRHILHDDEKLLAAFARLDRDVPAETLCYAVLADRDLWNEDLRQIDGLELRVTGGLSCIQRIGLRETLRLQKKL